MKQILQSTCYVPLTMESVLSKIKKGAYLDVSTIQLVPSVSSTVIRAVGVVSLSCNWRPWTGELQQGDLFLSNGIAAALAQTTILPCPDQDGEENMIATATSRPDLDDRSRRVRLVQVLHRYSLGVCTVRCFRIHFASFSTESTGDGSVV